MTRREAIHVHNAVKDAGGFARAKGIREMLKDPRIKDAWQRAKLQLKSEKERQAHQDRFFQSIRKEHRRPQVISVTLNVFPYEDKTTQVQQDRPAQDEPQSD